MIVLEVLTVLETHSQFLIGTGMVQMKGADNCFGSAWLQMPLSAVTGHAWNISREREHSNSLKK